LRSSNVRIVDPASAPTAPSSPNIPRNLLVSLLVGLAGGVSLAFILESRDDAVHSLEQAQMVAGLPSLAIVPLEARSNRMLPSGQRPPKRAAAIATALHPKSEIAEAYRGLRTSILLSRGGKAAKVLMVTSPLPQEGKTTTSLNLSIVLAQKGSRVLLIEGDMRRASISQILGLQSETGLSTVLTQNLDVHTALQPAPDLANLFVLPAGPVALYPSEILASTHMRDLLATLRGEFDHIIIDTPPVLSVTDAVLLSAFADSTLLVIRAGSTSKAALRRARDILAQVDARVLGVVLNAADFTEPDRYYYGSRYGGYHEYTPGKSGAMD
jgi:capsular exopolysaccharide synthesis family protein